jgi:signal peptide peptidase SppA
VPAAEHGRVLATELVELAAAATPARSTPRIQGGVAVLALRGLITPASSLLSLLFGGSAGGLAGFRADLQAALDNDDARSILINVDSPGGLVDQVPETAAAILAARDDKPIVAVANTLAASAAYWLASQAHEVVTTTSGELGSIGVYQVHEDVSGALENDGVKVSIISAGRYKAEANPFEPLADEARDYQQQVVDDYYSQFVNAVAQGRGVDADDVRDGYGQGRVLTAKRAVNAGLADRVATYDQTFTRLAGGRARVRQATNNGDGNGRAELAGATTFATPLDYTDEEKDRVLTTLAGLR